MRVGNGSKVDVMAVGTLSLVLPSLVEKKGISGAPI
jgi:hypothetical protein